MSALPAPTGLSGDMNSDLNWYNDGYSFSQACPDEETFTQNAETYFNYFKSKYDGRFGVADCYSNTMDFSEYYYKIENTTDLADYFSDNPCPTYTFYYVTDTTLEEGYFKADAVWTFEIRLDDGKLKIFIENAGKTRNGIYTNHYRMV